MKTNSPKRVLVIDVGGTHIKFLVSGRRLFRQFDSGPAMTARAMVRGVLARTADWPFDAVSIGYPGPVVHGRPLREPFNLGGGWVGFNYARAFGRPVRIVNDAAMQALGSYRGRRMLFLGLGTGLGSAMIVENVLQPMELAHLPWRDGKTYEDFIGMRGLRRFGRRRWQKYVEEVVRELKAALAADYVVLGGGNTHQLLRRPPGALLGDNRNAFRGGFRLWSASGRTRVATSGGEIAGSGLRNSRSGGPLPASRFREDGKRRDASGARTQRARARRVYGHT